MPAIPLFSPENQACGLGIGRMIVLAACSAIRAAGRVTMEMLLPGMVLLAMMARQMERPSRSMSWSGIS